MNNEMSKKLNSSSVLVGKQNVYINRPYISDRFERHTHDFFEVDFILDGIGESTIDDEKYAVQKKRVIIMPPMHYHDYVADKENGLVIMNFAFFISSIYLGAAKKVQYSNPIIFDLNDDEFECLKAMCDTALQKKLEKDAESDYYIKTCIEWLLLQVQNKEVATVVNPNRNIDFSKVLEYINSNISDPELNRDSVAKILNYSPSYFSKCFHRDVGIPFQKYLLNHRLSCAHELLKTTKQSATEIAYLVGFSSYGYFVKKYKLKYGIVPSDTRQK